MSDEFIIEIEKYIEGMSRDEFYNSFVKDVGQTEAFGALASFKTMGLTDEEKAEVRDLLSTKMGVPENLMDTDEKLDCVAAFSTYRAVHLR